MRSHFIILMTIVLLWPQKSSGAEEKRFYEVVCRSDYYKFLPFKLAPERRTQNIDPKGKQTNLWEKDRGIIFNETFLDQPAWKQKCEFGDFTIDTEINFIEPFDRNPQSNAKITFTKKGSLWDSVTVLTGFNTPDSKTKTFGEKVSLDQISVQIGLGRRQLHFMNESWLWGCLDESFHQTFGCMIIIEPR